jgi:hypothetical protein
MNGSILRLFMISIEDKNVIGQWDLKIVGIWVHDLSSITTFLSTQDVLIIWFQKTSS